MSSDSKSSSLVRAVLYARASTEDQEGSCPRQIDGVRKYAILMGYSIIREYVDDGISGASEQRPAFLKMVADCEDKGDFDAILVYSLDRFSRLDPADFFAAAKPFIDADVKLVTADEGPKDWNSAVGQVILAVGQMAKSQFLRDLSFHVTGGMLEAVRTHKGWPTSPPFGYRLVRVACPGTNKGSVAKLLPDQATADVARDLFRRYATGKVSLRRLALDLNTAGVPPKRSESGEWSICTVKRLLENPAFVGDTIFNRESRGKFSAVVGGVAKRHTGRKRKGCKANAPEEWIIERDTHEALVDRDTFALVQKMMEKRRGRASDGAKQRAEERGKKESSVCGSGGRQGERLTDGKGASEYLYSGILRCAHCGGAMQGKVSHFREIREGDEPVLDSLGRRTRVFGTVVSREPVRAYICNTNHLKGSCRFRSVYEEQITGAIADAVWHELLLNKSRRAGWEKRLIESLRKDETTAPADLTRIKKELAELRGRIAVRKDNLGELPKDMIPGEVAKIRDLEARANDLEHRRVQVGKTVARAKNIEDRVREAADRLCRIGTVTGGQEAFDRGLVRDSIERIDCTFEIEKYTVKTKNGPQEREKPVLSGLRIVFLAESLLGAELVEMYMTTTPLNTRRTSSTRSRTGAWCGTGQTT